MPTVTVASRGLEIAARGANMILIHAVQSKSVQMCVQTDYVRRHHCVCAMILYIVWQDGTKTQQIHAKNAQQPQTIPIAA